MIVDPYGGPGGWAEGLHTLRHREIGIEHDPAACATRTAAGHRTIRADVTTVPLAHLAGRVRGVIMSPPCQAFSTAGGGEGRAEIARLCSDVHAGHWGGTYPDKVRHMLEVGRWVDELRPEWLACEQVPPVLPVWEAYTHRLRALGYSVWAGILNAADYGVPQTRRRAILMASRTRRVSAPAPTHTRGGGATLFGVLAPWVSMAEALGWVGENDPARTLCGDRSPRWMYPDPDGTHGRQVGFPRRDDRGDSPDGYRERDWHDDTGPAPVITEKARSMVIRTNQNTDRAAGGRYERDTDRPSPTMTTNGRLWTWEEVRLVPGKQSHRERPTLPRGVDEPAPTLTFGHDSASWVFDRPATTIAGDARCWPPGHKINADDRARLGDEEAAARYGDRAGTEAVRLTIAQALVLQGFRADYPVQGTKTKQFEQVGNAVPPPLAARILEVLV